MFEQNWVDFVGKLREDAANLESRLNEHKDDFVKVNEQISGRLQEEIQVRFYKNCLFFFS